MNVFSMINNKYKEVFRFALVGLLATAIHYGIYLVLLNIIEVNIAYSLGYVISFLFNFFLSAHFTFKSKPNIKKGFGFALSHLTNYGLHLLLLNLFLYLGLAKAYAPIPVFMIVIPINFLLVRFVFKSKKFH